jgi:type I restriction enzyme R subunit
LKAGAKQSELVAALEPVVDRLHRRYKAAQEALKAARETKNTTGEEAAKGELDALLLFQSDMGTFVRLYTYLSQIFDYGSTDVEKRAIFFKHLLRLLDFGREREGIDLSRVVLTHHTLKNQGKRSLVLGDGDKPKLEPLSEAGGGSLHEKQKALMSEIVSRLNDLFDGDLTDGDKVVYAMDVIRGKLLESAMLRTQASNNTKVQFANSPDLMPALIDATIESQEAHAAMSTQVLESDRIRHALLDILLGPGQLYEALRE